jgi:biopolymer transport protein ExbB
MFLSPYELFRLGGPIMWPLLLCSIVAVAVALERILVFLWLRLPYGELVTRLGKAIQAGGAGQALALVRRRHSPLARVAETYLSCEACSDAMRQDLVAKEASYQLTVLERRLPWLSVIGSLAPMLGLLGTVWGLVEAFHQVEVLAGQVQPSDLASGIWQALITTVFGLVVAIPTVAVYHFLEQHVAAVELQMQWLVTSLNQWLEHEPSSAGRPQPPAVPEEDATEMIVGPGD